MTIPTRSTALLLNALLFICVHGCSGAGTPERSAPPVARDAPDTAAFHSTPSNAIEAEGATSPREVVHDGDAAEPPPQDDAPSREPAAINGETPPLPDVEPAPGAPPPESAPAPDASPATPRTGTKDLANTENPRLPPGLMDMMSMNGTNSEKAEAWDKFARGLSVNISLFAFAMRDAYKQAARMEQHREEKTAAASTLQAAGRGRDLTSEVKAPGTRVRWLRCPVGQTWNGTACTGLRTPMDWKAAKRACPKGYRLPTIFEFLDVLCGGASDYHRYLVRTGSDIDRHGCKRCTQQPNCAEMFGPDMSWYWTATKTKCRGDPKCQQDNDVYSAVFFKGVFEPYPSASKFFVRCVKK